MLSAGKFSIGKRTTAKIKQTINSVMEQQLLMPIETSLGDGLRDQIFLIGMKRVEFVQLL